MHLFLRHVARSVVLIACGLSSARAQPIRIVSDVLVDATPKSRAVLEPFMAVDPKDDNHLVAATMLSPPLGGAASAFSCATFSSTDGGAHWRRRDMPVTGCYDPWVVFLADGSVLFSSLGHDPALAGENNGLLVYRSTDGGRTWVKRPFGLSWGWDHPMLIADRATPRRKTWAYMVSSRDFHKGAGFFVAVSRSLDGGKTFDAPRNLAPENRMIKAEPPAVLSDGTLIVPYVEYAEFGLLTTRRRAYIVRSTNGIDFSEPTHIGDACGPPPDFRMSSFAVDASAGPFRDRLYFTCTSPGDVGVVVSHSGDRGATWSPAVSATSAFDQTPPTRGVMATAVTSTGVFGVVWLERASPPNAGCRDIYISASFDGGDTFTPAERVAQASSCPNSKLNGPYSGYGDYFALAADSHGRFRLVWADARTGFFQLRTALIDVSGATPPRR